MRKILSGVAVLAWASAAVAGKPDARLGQETQAWLDLQRGGEEATTTPSLVPGDVADHAYRRYLDSFAHPIPEQFPRIGIRREE